MALDNAALLEVLEAMQAAGVEDRVRTAASHRDSVGAPTSLDLVGSGCAVDPIGTVAPCDRQSAMCGAGTEVIGKADGHVLTGDVPPPRGEQLSETTVAQADLASAQAAFPHRYFEWSEPSTCSSKLNASTGTVLGP